MPLRKVTPYYTPEKEYSFFFFSDVNQKVNPILMKDEELLDLVNWYTDKLGAKKVRPGYKKFLDNPDSKKVTGLHFFKFPNGTITFLRFSGANIYAINPNTATSWGTAGFTYTSDFKRPEATILSGKVHIVDQISSTDSVYIEYDSSTFTNTNYVSGTDVVIPYKGKTITVYHRRIYVGSPYYAPNLYKSRLSWSSIDYENHGTSPPSPWTTDDNDISSANYRPIDPDFNGDILKVTSIGDRLNIYKSNGLYRYNEERMFTLLQMSPIDGSIATMPETSEDYFLTSEGFFKTNGRDVKPIGVGWLPIIKEIFRNGINLSKVVSYAVDFRYYCYLGDVTYNGRTVTNAVFVYDARIDELWLWSLGHDMTAFGHYTNNNGKNILVMGDVDGNTYYFDDNADDDGGKKISAMFRTKYFVFDDPRKYNQLVGLYMFAGTGSGSKIAVATDYSDQYETIGEIDKFIEQGFVNYEDVGMFKTLSVKIYWDGGGKRPNINGFIFTIKPLGERKHEGSQPKWYTA